MHQNFDLGMFHPDSNTYYKVLVLVFIILNSLSVAGQQVSILKKNNVTTLKNALLPYPAAKDSMWSKMLYPHTMSNDGGWISMTVNYAHQLDTLVLAKTDGKKNLEVPGGIPGKFSEDSKWYSCTSQDQSVWLMDLVKGCAKSFEKVKRYEFSHSSSYWLRHFVKEGLGKLEVFDLQSGLNFSPNWEIVEMKVHPTKDMVAISRKFDDENQVIIYELGSQDLKVLTSHPTNKWKSLQWTKDGKSLMFIEEDKNGGNLKENLHLQNLSGDVYVLQHEYIQQMMPSEGKLGTEMQISEQGSAIAFNWVTPVSLENSNEIEFWHTSDKWLYPRARLYERHEKNKHTLVWHPFINRVVNLSISELPTVAWNVDHPYALQFDKLQYEPLYQLYQEVDVFLTDPKTAQRHKILEKQYNGTGFITISPTGRYIAYFKEKDWWVYDINLQKHTNITQGLHVAFEDEEFDQSGRIPPYGNPGWTLDDENILLYDRYDIWKIKPDGSQRQRITNGRSQKQCFRLAEASKGNSSLTSYPEFNSYLYNLQKGVYMSVYEEDHSMGYVFRNPNGTFITLVKEPKHIDRLVTSLNHEHLAYRQQDYNDPPAMVIYNKKDTTGTVLYETNRELSKYDLGRSELIYYQTEGGVTLQGTLIYPAGYDPGKNYPLIVNIYEKMSYKLHRFNPPSEYQFTGFNTMSLAIEGYAVLFPNIKYTARAPGISALSSVTAAVKKVIEMGIANPNAVGLIGHSFGGYETLFIVTQTDMFAAAIAGGAITDFWSYYWNMGWNRGEADLWRFENHQFRMGKSIFEIPEDYYANSPLHHVQNVTTPVLLWTGKDDRQVNWHQSVSFYLALRKLNKNATLVLYPNERHNLMNPENQKHLKNTIHNWLDKHLKNK